jgi:predicted TIM-barrel fold metal-dependent hydrolase
MLNADKHPDTIMEFEGLNRIGPATGRHAAPTKRTWPAGTVLVSADGHFLEGDLWIERFPPHLRAKAPRMRFRNGGWNFEVEGEELTFGLGAKQFCELTECVPGMGIVADRLRDMDTEGVSKELLFPQRLLTRNYSGETELREYYYGSYNSFMAEECAKSGGRLFFAAVPNFWNPSAAISSIEEIKRLNGARALLVPNNPRKDSDGEPIYWSSSKMDPFWKAVEESGLPLCFHIGEGIVDAYPGAMLTFATINLHSLVAPWATLAHGGVFDRHPGLRIVFVEAGISWVAKAIHDADLVYHTYDPVITSRTRHQPSWYWFNNCYATFVIDPAGLDLLPRIGVDRVMWSVDYPHPESSLGFTEHSIDAVFKATTVENAQKILGKTALELFRMS